MEKYFLKIRENSVALAFFPKADTKKHRYATAKGEYLECWCIAYLIKISFFSHGKIFFEDPWEFSCLGIFFPRQILRNIDMPLQKVNIWNADVLHIW